MKCLNPYFVRGPSTWPTAEFQWLPVPCGKCPTCKARKRQEWTFRLSEEMKTADYTAFATLTYSEKNLPTTEHNDISDIPTLNYRDVQLFLKRFRKKLDKLDIKLRYFICGEYGSNTLRPHYHAIFYFRSEIPNNVLNHVGLLPSLFRSSWNLGDILDFQQCKSNGSSSYCNKYLNKYYKLRLLETQEVEKSLKSQNLGRDYIAKNKDWHTADPENRQYAIYEGYKIGLPRTFRKKIFGKDKLTDSEANELYNKLYDKEIEQIKQIKANYYDTYKNFIKFPYLAPFRESSPEDISEVEHYLTKTQSKDKF